MKYLQILNVVFAAFGATMVVTLGVVWVLYAVYAGSQPQLRGQMHGLVVLVAWFAAFGLAGAAAFAGHRRRWPLRWLAQAAPLLPLAGIVQFFAGLRG